LIFDPDLADESLEAALHALEIEQAPATGAKTNEVQKLSFTSLEEFCSVIPPSRVDLRLCEGALLT
jgi:predicted transcriptional regulator